MVCNGDYVILNKICHEEGKLWSQKTILTPSLYIEVPVPSQESELSCICVVGVSLLPLPMIYLLDFGTVPTVWHLVVFILYLRYQYKRLS